MSRDLSTHSLCCLQSRFGNQEWYDIAQISYYIDNGLQYAVTERYAAVSSLTSSSTSLVNGAMVSALAVCVRVCLCACVFARVCVFGIISYRNVHGIFACMLLIVLVLC